MRTPPPRRRSQVRTVALTLLLALPALAAWGGPLDPPPGPIASTGKPLAEIEPRTAINAANTPGDADSSFRITQPGSYYLTGHLLGEANKHGIKIATSGVTIDLAGFGVFGAPNSLSGIATSVSGLESIEIRSGMIANWGMQGVDTLNASNCRLEDVRATRNAGGGLRSGNAAVITGCVSSNNSLEGISTNTGGVISNCSAHQNGTQGFFLSTGGSVTNCVSSLNHEQGYTATVNVAFIGCAAFGNTLDGFLASTGCVITGCTARTNGLSGMRVTNNNVVTNNTCSDNGQAAVGGSGILVVSTDNRVEGNNCTNQDRGIRVDFLGNFIARNVCSGNTINWEISTGNICLVIQATASPPITGNAGGVSPGSNDPNANYTY